MTASWRGTGHHARMGRPRSASVRDIYFNAGALPFWAFHVAAILGVIALGWSWSGAALAAALYVARMFFVCTGYHRYFSHRSFKTSRWFQFVLGFCAQTSMQRGVLWWAATHRHHHRFSDTPDDVHSPRRDGFWWAHMGWSTSGTSEDIDRNRVRDLASYPELRFLDRIRHAPAILLAAVLLLVGGVHALVWGFLVSTVVLWHGTFTINSLSHVIGSRRYATGDDSRNHWALALLTLGEGWHNNHHHYMSSARQGFRWWEIDLAYYGLRVLGFIGLIWEIRVPPRHLLGVRSSG